MPASGDSNAFPLDWMSQGYLLLDSERDSFEWAEEALAPAAVADETRLANVDLEALCKQFPPANTVPLEVLRKSRREGKGVLPGPGPLDEGRWLEFVGDGGRTGALRVLEPAWQPGGVFLHIHGGGWTFGAPDEFDVTNLALAREAGVAVASARYRLAPEHPWPAALDDCFNAYAWLIERAEDEFGTDRIAIGGDSAGAHLAVATLLKAREEGLPSPMAAVLTYGCYDLRMTPSMANWGERQLVLSTPVVQWFVANLVPHGIAEDPMLLPLLADLNGMPPALFAVGTEDPLLDDSRLMAERWAAAGSLTRLALFPGGAHAFDMQNIPIAQAYHRLRADFLAETLGAS